MQIFISYSSDPEDRAIAESIALSLRGADHDVFFDRDSLPAGETYDTKIADKISDTDLFIFLISPTSVADKRYTLTELALARARWKNPNDRVFGVMIRKTDYALVPTYVRSTTVLEPAGNIAAEVTARVEGQFGRPRASVAIGTLSGIGLVTGALSGASLFPLLDGKHHLHDLRLIVQDMGLLGVGLAAAPAIFMGLGVGYGAWRWAGRRMSAFAVVIGFILLGSGVAFGLASLLGKVETDSRAVLMLHIRYAVIGLCISVATSLAMAVLSPKFRTIELIALVVCVGTLFGFVAMSILTTAFRPETINHGLREFFPLVMAIWQAAVGATIGYGLSRLPRPA